MKQTDLNKKHEYTDQELEELSEWMQSLTIAQWFFLRDSLEEFYEYIAKENGADYVH